MQTLNLHAAITLFLWATSGHSCTRVLHHRRPLHVGPINQSINQPINELLFCGASLRHLQSQSAKPDDAQRAEVISRGHQQGSPAGGLMVKKETLIPSLRMKTSFYFLHSFLAPPHHSLMECEMECSPERASSSSSFFFFLLLSPPSSVCLIFKNIGLDERCQ